MKRRSFIKNTLAGTTLLTTGGISAFNTPLLSSGEKKLVILHTNDTHSHIESFPANHSKYANQGGVARRAVLIEQIRAEGHPVLLLDAGDIFQGTPYFNYYGGALEIDLMNKLKYDASTIGNHEFDNGIESLAGQLQNAKFSMINANYDFSNTIMDGFTKPYQIFEKEGIKIGIFGLGIELNGLVNKREYGETEYLDPIEIAQDMTNILKNEKKCDLIICLSHLGYAYRNDTEKISDIKLAEKTKDIDIIIGGHTHTFMEKATLVKNIEGKEVCINQAGCFGLLLGRMDVTFSANPNKVQSASNLTV